MTRKSQGSFYDMLPQEKKDELRAAYKAAVGNNAPGFTAIGHEWVTSYVKYLFKYVDGKGVVPMDPLYNVPTKLIF